MRPSISIVFFLAPAIFHALALTWPAISIPESPETHLLFVLVNLWFANEVMKPSARFFVGLGALTLHQLIVHTILLGEAVQLGGFDVQSAIVLVSLVPLWTLLILDQLTTGER